VLNDVSGQIGECLERAQDCAHKAATYPDGSPLRKHFLEMEQRWLRLARSIEFGERLDSSTRHGAKD
jgi:hypothetical protein